MIAILWVMGGGAMGAGLRYGIGRILPFQASSFPWATFAVDLLGCLLIGILFGYVDKRPVESEHLRWFWTSGFCGGFTTFSAFSLETFSLIQHDRWPIAIGYVLGSILLGMTLTWLGWWMMRA